MLNLGATVPMMGRICPPGGNRVKENLGATAVGPVAPVDTFLLYIIINRPSTQGHSLLRWLNSDTFHFGHTHFLARILQVEIMRG